MSTTYIPMTATNFGGVNVVTTSSTAGTWYVPANNTYSIAVTPRTPTDTIKFLLQRGWHQASDLWSHKKYGVFDCTAADAVALEFVYFISIGSPQDPE